MVVKPNIRTISALSVFVASIALSPIAFADDVLLARHLSNGVEASLSALKTGDQLAVQALEGEHKIAGHSINFSGFSGVFGQSSDSAYILVADGQANSGGAKAKAGDVLVLMPYGGETLVQKYAARQFLDSWPEQAVSSNPDIYGQFQKVSKKQKWGVFFGRLEATAFNVVAPGSSSQELARRSVIGDDAVQSIRFSGVAAPEAIERGVVAEFIKALAAGDASTVASLMDPSPFGASDLRGGADGARMLMAKQLIASQDWRRQLGTAVAEPIVSAGKWKVANGTRTTVLGLRPIGDFTYVQTIEAEL